MEEVFFDATGVEPAGLPSTSIAASDGREASVHVTGTAGSAGSAKAAAAARTRRIVGFIGSLRSSYRAIRFSMSNSRRAAASWRGSERSGT